MVYTIFNILLRSMLRHIILSFVSFMLVELCMAKVVEGTNNKYITHLEETCHGSCIMVSCDDTSRVP